MINESNQDLRNKTPLLISKTRKEFNNYLLRELKSCGLPKLAPSHGDIIFTLLKEGPLSMKGMAKKIERDPSTVTSLVEKLCNLGVIELKKNENDLRSKLITLTPKGMAFQKTFFEISEKLITEIWKDIPESEQTVFFNTLSKIKTNMINLY